jgi:serine protease Do
MIMSLRRESVRGSGASLKFIPMGALSLALFGGGVSASALAGQAGTDAQGDRAMALANDLSVAFARVARDVTPAIVNITTFGEQQVARGPMIDPNDEFFRRFFGEAFPQQPEQPRGRRGQTQPLPEAQLGTGSGIVVSADGYILTNNHVIERSTRVQVAFADNRQYTATVVGRDPATDVAVLKIEADALPFAKLGNSDAVEVGQWVLAIGNPFGLNQTVTAGIISAKGRTLNGNGTTRRPGGTMFEDFLQTDAAINPGNSGGALVNLKGEVIGMNTAIFTRSGGYMGIGFAIPSNMASGVLEQLRATGTVQRGFLGVGIQDLDPDTAKSLGFEGRGVLINEITAGGPADKAGLKTEDIVLTIDGRATDSANALRNIIASITPGRSVKMEVFRDGKKQTLEATLGNRDAQAAAGGAPAGNGVGADNVLGVAVVGVTAADRERLGDERARGVMITEVAADSPVAMLGLRPGDMIVAINRTEITDAATFTAALKSANLAQGIRLRVRSNGAERVATIMINR